MKYYSVASLPRASHFALAFSVASLPRASCIALALSVAWLPRTRIALCARKNFRKDKCVSMDSKCSETHRNAKKSFVQSAKRKRRSATLPTSCQSQGPKECPYQVSCRLVQNCKIRVLTNCARHRGG